MRATCARAWACTRESHYHGRVRRLYDASLLAAVAAAVFFGASAYAAIGGALGSYSPGPLALFRMLVASAALAAYAAFSRMRLPSRRGLPAGAPARPPGLPPSKRGLENGVP